MLNRFELQCVINFLNRSKDKDKTKERQEQDISRQDRKAKTRQKKKIIFTTRTKGDT